MKKPDIEDSAAHCLVTDKPCTAKCPCANCRITRRDSDCHGKPHTKWRCSTCRKTGTVWCEFDTPVAELVEYIFMGHAHDSPKCKATAMGEMDLSASIRTQSGGRKRE